MAPIRELAEQYRQRAKRGAKVVLVSPQSYEKTPTLAENFDVDFGFLVDNANRAVRLLEVLRKRAAYGYGDDGR